MSWLKGKKTFIVAGAMVFVSLLNFVTGDISLIEFLGSGDLQILLEGLGIGFLRAGVSKATK
jgi:hypothetical protein